jgi:hypothetical protein
MKSISVACLLLSAGLSMAADSTDGKLSDADGKKWVDRLQRLIPCDGWTVTARGNEATVKRDKPVLMVVTAPNEPPAQVGQKPREERRVIRFVLRFAPRMSLEEYERLAAINDSSTKEYERLKRNVGLPHKFDQFIATTDEEKERLKSFEAAVAKLPHHSLPDMYSPDDSIFFFHPWDGWSTPAEEVEDAECSEVQDALTQYFGLYSTESAGHGQELGQYLPLDPL